MEEFREAMANKCRERDLHVRIKKIYTHMRENELKEEEEELKQREKTLKKGGRINDTGGIIGEAQKEICYIISLHIVGSTLCVVISINICFIKFVVHEINYKMVLSLKWWC
jgi:hypothetical protein